MGKGEQPAISGRMHSHKDTNSGPFSEAHGAITDFVRSLTPEVLFVDPVRDSVQQVLGQMRKKGEEFVADAVRGLNHARGRMLWTLADFVVMLSLLAGCVFRGSNTTSFSDWFHGDNRPVPVETNPAGNAGKGTLVPTSDGPQNTLVFGTGTPVPAWTVTPKPPTPAGTGQVTSTPTPTPKPTETQTPTPTATATEAAPNPVESYKAFKELMDQEFENLKDGKTFRLKGAGTTTIYKLAGHFVENILSAMLEDATGKKFPAGIISIIVDDELGPKLRPTLVGPLHAVVIQDGPMVLYNSTKNAPYSGRTPPFVWNVPNKKPISPIIEGLGDFATRISYGGDLAGIRVSHGVYKNVINQFARNRFKVFFVIPDANGNIVVYKYYIETSAVVDSFLYDATIKATNKFILNDGETLDKLVALDLNNPEDYTEIQNLLLAQGISFFDKKALEAFYKAEVETYAASGGVR